jgi:hypothetical protein
MESQFESHLTDEQFAELLLGSTSAPVQAHLGVCAQCAEEADRVSGAIGSFEQQTRLWAERRTATQPVLSSPRHAALAWLQLPAGPQAWAAAALAVALAAGLGVSVRSHRAGMATQVASQVSSEHSSFAESAPVPNAAARPAAAPASDVESTIAQAEPAARVSPARLKADNDLLSAIDGELRADESSAASPYGLSVAARGDREKAPSGMINE